METWQLVLLLLPVIIIQFTLMIIALVDLVNREKVRYDNKILWVIIIVIFNIIGPIVYLLWGREEPGGEDGDY